MGRQTQSPVSITGTLIEQTIESDGLAGQGEGDTLRGTGLRERQVIAWSDPRLPADKLTVINYVRYAGEPPAAVFTGALLLESPEGSWVGTATGVSFPDGSLEGQDILVGHGGYEGLYAVLFARAPSRPTAGGVTTWHGLICAGSPPPMPQLPFLESSGPMVDPYG